MRIDSDSREYATWTVSGADTTTTLEVSLAGAWHPLERVDATTVRVLVAGPTATGNPAGTVALPVGRTVARIRATDTPEVVIRGCGIIDVKPA